MCCTRSLGIDPVGLIKISSFTCRFCESWTDFFFYSIFCYRLLFTDATQELALERVQTCINESTVPLAECPIGPQKCCNPKPTNYSGTWHTTCPSPYHCHAEGCHACGEIYCSIKPCKHFQRGVLFISSFYSFSKHLNKIYSIRAGQPSVARALALSAELCWSFLASRSLNRENEMNCSAMKKIAFLWNVLALTKRPFWIEKNAPVDRSHYTESLTYHDIRIESRKKNKKRKTEGKKSPSKDSYDQVQWHASTRTSADGHGSKEWTCCAVVAFSCTCIHDILFSPWKKKSLLSLPFTDCEPLISAGGCALQAGAETTRSLARRFAARSLLVSCPPSTMVSSYRCSSLSLLAATCSGCLFGKAARHTLLVSCPSGVCLNRSLLRAMSRQVPCCHCSAVSLERRAAICIRCRCLTWLVFASECSFITSSIGNTKGKLFTKSKLISRTFCMLQGIFAVQTAFQHFFHSRFARSLTPARWPACQSISECSAGKSVRPISCEQTGRRTVLLYRYRLAQIQLKKRIPFLLFFFLSIGRTNS